MSQASSIDSTCVDLHARRMYISTNWRVVQRAAAADFGRTGRLQYPRGHGEPILFWHRRDWATIGNRPGNPQWHSWHRLRCAPGRYRRRSLRSLRGAQHERRHIGSSVGVYRWSSRRCAYRSNRRVCTWCNPRRTKREIETSRGRLCFPVRRRSRRLHRGAADDTARRICRPR